MRPDSTPAPAGRHAAPAASATPTARAPRGARRVLAAAVCVAAALGIGAGVGHLSRNSEVAGLHADLARQHAAVVDARATAEDQAERAAAVGRSTYVATATSHHAAARATSAAALAQQALREAGVCRTAMRAEMQDVAVLLDILNRDDAVYTVEHLPDVDADARGIRRCLGSSAVVAVPPDAAVAPPATPPSLSPAVHARPSAS